MDAKLENFKTATLETGGYRNVISENSTNLMGSKEIK